MNAEKILEILKANIKLHSIRQGHGVFGISSFETIAHQIDELYRKEAQEVEPAGEELLSPIEIGDSLDLEVERTYPCSDGGVTSTISVDKVVQVQARKSAAFVNRLLEEIKSKMSLEECEPDVEAYFNDFYWIDKYDLEDILSRYGGKK